MAVLPLDRLPPLFSPLGVASVAILGFAALYCIERFLLSQPLPKGIPLLREPEGARSFSLRTRLAYLRDCQSLFREAHHNYSKKGKPVIIPGFGLRNELIMPASAMKWVLAQGDDVLSVTEAFAEIDQARWSMGHSMFVTDPWQGHLVKTDMNRVLETICSAMNAELQDAFDDAFGTDTDNWKEVSLDDTIQLIVARAASRFTVGAPLCRNEKYLRTSLAINQLLIANAGLVSGAPALLRPILGTVFGTWITILINRIKPLVVPLLRQRIANLTDDPSPDEPLDHLQMMLRYAKRERPSEFRSEDNLVRRLVVQNFGSIHNTQMQIINLILNVLGSDAEHNTIATIRDEVDRVLGPGGDTPWTKALVSQLVRTDSVGRETLRLQSFGGRAVFRKVMADGLVTPDGIALPRGTLFSFHSYAVHVDPEGLEDAAAFDPFRFSRIREEAAARDQKGPVAVGLVSTSPEFLPFGHGKHACPGRFLIDFEFKMILAYMLRNYDVALPESCQGKRPPNLWLAEANIPPSGVRIRVKRRARS